MIIGMPGDVFTFDNLLDSIMRLRNECDIGASRFRGSSFCTESVTRNCNVVQANSANEPPSSMPLEAFSKNHKATDNANKSNSSHYDRVELIKKSMSEVKIKDEENLQRKMQNKRSGLLVDCSRKVVKKVFNSPEEAIGMVPADVSVESIRGMRLDGHSLNTLDELPINLSILNVSNCKLTSLKWISNSRNLRAINVAFNYLYTCLLYTSPSPRD
eukprot:TRINITY_DN10720_c0_g1_i3.p1 TRINITY_DN10720_c0_g1~~TRINITY_DN10720_c0_g1_i3.p1  ORF type:complete len:215 (+),score=25.08 TRINITY_DN10720_c0_g1_i3:215-859(+)